MDLIQNILNNYLKGGRKQGVNENIARYMLAHYYELSGQKLAQVAENCNVSTPSVIRFCRELGFTDFKDFKYRLKEEEESYLDVDIAHLVLCNDGEKNTYQESVIRWGKRLNKQILNTLLHIDREAVLRLARDIIDYQYLYLFGMSLTTVFAEYLRLQLLFEGKILSTCSQIRYEARLNNEPDQTLAVVVSQHGRYLNSEKHLLHYLRNNSAKLWLITQESLHTPYKADVDEILFVPGAENLALEIHGMLVVAELLSSTVEELYHSQQ